MWLSSSPHFYASFNYLQSEVGHRLHLLHPSTRVGIVLTFNVLRSWWWVKPIADLVSKLKFWLATITLFLGSSYIQLLHTWVWRQANIITSKLNPLFLILIQLNLKYIYLFTWCHANIINCKASKWKCYSFMMIKNKTVVFGFGNFNLINVDWLRSTYIKW